MDTQRTESVLEIKENNLLNVILIIAGNFTIPFLVYMFTLSISTAIIVLIISIVLSLVLLYLFFSLDALVTPEAIIIKKFLGSKTIKYDDILSMSTVYIEDLPKLDKLTFFPKRMSRYQIKTNHGSFTFPLITNTQQSDKFEQLIVKYGDLVLAQEFNTAPVPLLDPSNTMTKHWTKRGTQYKSTGIEDTVLSIMNPNNPQSRKIGPIIGLILFMLGILMMVGLSLLTHQPLFK